MITTALRDKICVFCAATGLLLLFALPGQAIVFDFETDDYGTTLVNGQAICTAPAGCVVTPDGVTEFGNIADVSTTADGPGSHMGAGIYDSTPGVNSADPDLWVDLGNVLILQNDQDGNHITDPTYGEVFTNPNDERNWDDAGTIVFDFHQAYTMESIILIDVNGGVGVDVTMTDSGGLSRIYAVPEKWTKDVASCGGLNPPGCIGYHTLDLVTLADQDGETPLDGGPATASEDLGFDPTDVIQFSVHFYSWTGTGPISGALDNITFTPEPGSGLLLMIGLMGLTRVKRS